MSRTDKDQPHWISDHYREVHAIPCIVGKKDCSLPARPNSLIYRRFTACYWKVVPDWKWWMAPPPKWYRDHVWNNPQRVDKRDTLRKAIQEYRATGETDVETRNEQHRHSATWSYW